MDGLNSDLNDTSQDQFVSRAKELFGAALAYVWPVSFSRSGDSLLAQTEDSER